MAGNTSVPGATVTSRVLALLGAFDARHRELSLSDLARRSGVPVATARARWQPSQVFPCFGAPPVSAQARQIK